MRLSSSFSCRSACFFLFLLIFSTVAFHAVNVRGANSGIPIDRLWTKVDAEGRRSPTHIVYKIANPNGLCNFRSYEEGAYKQVVEQVVGEPNAVKITVDVPGLFPEMTQPFPLLKTVKRMEMFSTGTLRIQSNDERIAKVAQEVYACAREEKLQEIGVFEENGGTVSDAHRPAPLRQEDIVRETLKWMHRYILYSDDNLNELTDAVTTLERRRGHAVASANLTVAILRNLKIPARVVRTFSLTRASRGGLRFGRKSLVEVYYQADKKWMLYSPQVSLPVAPLNVFLYVSADWDQKQHDAFKPTSTDVKTKIMVLEAR